ncbi:hypothetical protein C1O60_06415 [Akkermansia muciniphila]|nr:hypothetical protein C1O60_06415 [Akkermansia muciniphila]QAA66628.1 hypothetical protein C1O61_06495 [Akkermansia muciniphila]
MACQGHPQPPVGRTGAGAGDSGHAGRRLFPFHLYLQNRASEHFPRALPLLRSRPSAEPQGIFFPHRPPEQGLPPPAHSSRPSFPAYPDCLHCAGRNSSHVAGSYQGRHRPFRHGRLFHQHQRRLRHGAGPLNVHEHFTNYGQTILLVLFQVGAFGIMTFTYFVSLMVGQGLSLRSKVTISNLLDEEGIAQVDRFIKNIIAVTFGVEALGAIGLYFSWRHVPGLEGDTLWWYAVFHSVSGFCNAGFSLFADNLATPGVAYNMGGQIIIMVMVLCGSLGFAMYLEIVRRARVALGWDARNTVSRHWSTYSWLVVRMTAALVLGGGLILFLIKIIDGSLFTSADPWYWILWESLFNATARTAGFNISDMALNSAPYALFLGALMFIGGNPGSTTGGVHTTAFAVSCGEVARILQGKKDVVMHKRRIARNVVERAVITVILAGAWVGMMTTVMCFAEPRLSLERLFFEVVSSFATVGFSWNVTPELSDAGKWIIVFNMIVGRVGMVAFVLAFMKQPTKSPLRYPETRLPLS